MRATVPVLLSACTLACRLDPGSDDERVAALVNAWCDVQSRCAESCSTTAVSHDLCVLQWTSQFETSRVAADTYDLEHSPMCLERVLDAFDELECDEPETPWAWAQRTCPVWHGAGDRGDECRPYEMPEQLAFASTCRPGLTCALDPAAGDDAWRCRDVTEVPDDGDGCLRYQGGSIFDERCADELRCDMGVCASGPGPGDTCDCGGLFGCEGCVDGFCDAEVGEASGTCRAFVDVGESCGTTTAQTQCEYICEPAQLVCIAPMDAGPLACALTLQL